jgi:hypothetical protein
MSKNILFDPFPKQQEFLEKALSGLYSFILYGGGIRGGKSFAGIGLLLILCKIFPRSRWAIVRKDMPTIVKNVFPTWDKICPANFVKNDRRKSAINPHVEFNNGSMILFFPENYSQDKELDRFKGLEVNGFLAEEINELQYETFEKMIERAGSYILSGEVKQPYPLIAATCNPSPGWVKKIIYTPYIDGLLREGWTYVRARIFDNPHIPQEYLETLKTLSHYMYRVFVEGDWDFQLKSPNAYWRSFDIDKHVTNYIYDNSIPIHISVDSNVLPYIAISLWQLPSEGEAIQIAEIPAEDPNNSAQKAAELAVNFLNKIHHNDIIILHGDASANARNTIDPQKRSFITLFQGKLEESFVVRNRVSRSNPSISLRGEFINAIYEGLVPGLSIRIDESCKESINDYIVVQQDMNGGMQKKKITKNNLTYEPNGHFSDTKAYFLCDVFIEEFNTFKNAGSTHDYILKILPNHNQM